MVELCTQLTVLISVKNLWLKIVDLTLQTVALAQMLGAGSPATLTYSYAALLATNATSCALMITLGSHHSAFSDVLLDSVYVRPYLKNE